VKLLPASGRRAPPPDSKQNSVATSQEYGPHTKPSASLEEPLLEPPELPDVEPLLEPEVPLDPPLLLPPGVLPEPPPVLPLLELPAPDSLLLAPEPPLELEEPLLEPPELPDVEAPLEPDVASTAPASPSAPVRVEPPQAAASASAATIAKMFAAARFIATPPRLLIARCGSSLSTRLTSGLNNQATA
jgi:hypothetical protein